MTDISRETIIWFPGEYEGRSDDDYTQIVENVSLVKLTELVQKRAQEDGEWAITNGFAGANEEKMRRMMAFVSSETNIQQCVGHIEKDIEMSIRTVDWVCRDLANASKVMIR